MIIILQDGPILVDGPLTLKTVAGKSVKAEGKKVALCRCGNSQNKPFCDGAHKPCKFEAESFNQ